MAEKITDKKVTIIGLGLIGGSIARALHERMGIKNITASGQKTNVPKIAAEYIDIVE